MGKFNISMFCLTFLRILQNALPVSALYWEFCDIYVLFRGKYSTEPELCMRFYWYACASYNSVWIDVFVYVIQYNCLLYFILVMLSYISHMHALSYHCVIVTSAFISICLWILYIFLLRYVCVLYKIYS